MNEAATTIDERSERTYSDWKKQYDMNHLRGTVAPDVLAYLEDEATRRGIGVREVYEEEVAAQKAIEALGITEKFLADAAARSVPPQVYLSGEQERPF
jgi:isocitrate lyase